MSTIESRLGAVEAELALLRQETAAARALATGASRHVADCRAEMRERTCVLNALLETQIERGTQIVRLVEGLSDQD